MLGDQKLLSQPQSSVHLLPQRLGHNADPKIGGENLGGTTAIPFHHRNVKLTTANTASVKLQAVEEAFKSLS